MRRAALAALLLIVLVASAGGAAAPTAGGQAGANPLVAIHFEFKSDEFATHYTVVNTLDPAGLLNLADAAYSWTLRPPVNDLTCNNHGALNSKDKEFVWKHGNVGEPGHDDGCHHDIGLPGYGHQGTVSVDVADSRWFCHAEYTGTQATDGSPIGEGPAGSCNPQPTSPPPPPPPPPSCKCALLTARVVPSSLKVVAQHLESESGKTYTNYVRHIKFTVHWVLNCSRGSGGCSGRLAVQEPEEGKFRFQWLRKKEVPRDPQVFAIDCKSRCGGIEDGGTALDLYGSPTGGGTFSELAKKWEHAKFKFLIKRICQGKKLRPVTIVIALDGTGEKVDLKRTKLG